MNEMICEKCGESFEAFKNTIFGKNLYVCPGCNKIQRRLGRDKKVGVSC